MHQTNDAPMTAGERARIARACHGISEELAESIGDTYGPEEIIPEAVDRENPVALNYRDAEGKTSARVLSPYEVRDTQAGDTIVVGFDHDREAIRSFRFDRIDTAALAETEFIAPVEEV